MKKPELLVPAGNMEALNQAIHNGADAIYIGGKNFGARKYANNFTNDEIKEATKICHLYDVKLYITMNTLIKNEEVDDFIDQVEYLYKIGVDAIIMQDFGMICLVREKFPNLEIHASTQANNSSIDTINLFHEIGVKRIVLSRELTKDEISKINTNIEKEVFIHGALCISYSGCCLMSSMIGTRSGNRGECAGSCRLPYSLEHNGTITSSHKYLLSTKELNTSRKLDEIISLGIDSLKIEGRMKSPQYVGMITKFYRNIIDKNEKFNIDKQEEKLKTIFNRGFTQGHIFNIKNDDIINNQSPNHIGLKIGKVLEVTPKKIKIKLEKKLNQLDGIRFLESGKGLIVNYLYDKNLKLTSTCDDVCYIDNKINLQSLDTVSKTQDNKLIKELNSYEKKKINISMKVFAKIEQDLTIIIDDKKNKVIVKSNKVQKAKTQPIDKEKIKYQLMKLGDTPFKCNDIKLICDDNIFISIKELNELRRNAIEQLIKKRTQNKNNLIIKEPIFSEIKNIKSNNLKCANVYNEQQLLMCKKLGFDEIYVPSKLYSKYKNDKKVYNTVPRCNFNISNKLDEKSLVNDYLNPNNKELIADYGMNIYNIYTAYYLYKLGFKKLTLSCELSQINYEEFINEFYSKFKTWPNIDIICYGRVENMLIKNNILNINKDDFSYNLIDIKKRKFPVYFDGINTHIMNYENKKISIDKKLKNKVNIRFLFYNESIEEIKNIVKEYF